MPSALEQYCNDILSGKLVACSRMIQVSQMLLDKIHDPGEYHFDERIADKHINFIEKYCKIPSGKIGLPFLLQPFQRAQLQAAFGFVDDNDVRQYNEVFVVEGRKNGKSSMLSAVLLDMLANDNEGSPQCVTAATKLDQAKLTYNAAHKMVRQSPELSKHIKKRQTDLYFPYNMGTIRALANNTNSLDGLDLHCCVIDELSAIRSRDTYDLMKQAMSARRQPMLFCITTNGFLRDGIFDAQYKYACDVLDGKIENPKFLPFIYELDSVAEWTDETAWLKANPGLGTIKSESYLRECVQKAKDDISFRPTVLVKDFNLKQNANTAWLKWEYIEQCMGEVPRNIDYCIGGFDAADSVDLAAAVAIMKKPDDPKLYVRSMFWIPESVIEEQVKSGSRQERDNVPYMQWVAEGWMRTVPGCKVDKRVFLDWFVDLREEEGLYSLFIGYDPWHIDDSLLRDFSGNFGERAMNVVRQGVKTLSEPMKSLEADFKAGNVVFDNPVMQMCLANTEIRADINGNIQPVKGLDARKRIDGTAALLCAYRQLIDHHDEYTAMNA